MRTYGDVKSITINAMARLFLCRKKATAIGDIAKKTVSVTFSRRAAQVWQSRS